MGLKEVVRKGVGSADHKLKERALRSWCGNTEDWFLSTPLEVLGLGPRTHVLLGPPGEAGLLNCGALPQ